LSTLAKAFVVIVLLLSVLVAVATMGLFAQKTDWQSKAKQANSEKEKALQQMEADKADFTSQLDQKNEKIRQLTADVEDEQHRADVIARERDSNASLLKESEAKLSQAMTENAKLSEVAKAQSERISQLEQQNETLKTEKAEAFQKQQEYFNRVAELERELTNLERKYRDLVEKEQPTVEKTVTPVTSPTEVGRQAPGKIDGVIREKMENFLAISVGSDDGVKQDYIFHVYRGTSYLGGLVVTEVHPEMSIGRILKEITTDPNNIRKGDNVTTRFTE
jgi:cell shape-determining protein MreC